MNREEKDTTIGQIILLHSLPVTSSLLPINLHLKQQ